jgi:hypothetical protein
VAGQRRQILAEKGKKGKSLSVQQTGVNKLNTWDGVPFTSYHTQFPVHLTHPPSSKKYRGKKTLAGTQCDCIFSALI